MDIYVGNISYQLSEADLQALFEDFGEVNSVKIVTDKMTGKSKGFGFVSMGENADTQRAIEEMKGREIQGRNLVVNEARQKEESGAPRRSFSSNNSFGGGGNRPRSNNDRGGGYQKDNNRGRNDRGGGYGDRSDRNDRYDGGGNHW
jgi:RNA recognition motif-containing protein